MNQKFVIVTTGGELRCGQLSTTQVDKLAEHGYELLRHADDMGNAINDGTNAIYVVDKVADVVALYDPYSLASLSYDLCNSILHKFSGEQLSSYVS